MKQWLYFGCQQVKPADLRRLGRSERMAYCLTAADASRRGS